MLATYPLSANTVENEVSERPSEPMAKSAQELLLEQISENVGKIESALFHDGEDGLRGDVRNNTYKIENIDTKLDGVLTWITSQEKIAREVKKDFKNMRNSLFVAVASAALIAIAGTLINQANNSAVRAIADQLQEIQDESATSAP